MSRLLPSILEQNRRFPISQLRLAAAARCPSSPAIRDTTFEISEIAGPEKKCNWLALLMAALWGFTVPGQSAAQQVTQFPIGFPVSSGASIFSLRGEIWCLTGDAGFHPPQATYATVISTDGSVRNRFQLPNAAYAFSPAGDRSVWFLSGLGQVGKSDLAGRVFTRYLGDNMVGLVGSPDGAAWFGEFGAESVQNVARIAADGSKTEFTPATPVFTLTGLLVGADGSLWYGAQTLTSPGVIGRVTLTGAVTEYPIPNGACQRTPGVLTTGADGNVWFSEYESGGSVGGIDPCSTEPNRVGRITSDGSITEFVLDPNIFGYGANGLLAGPDGGLWFAAGTASPAFGRISVTGDLTLYPLAGFGGTIGSMTFGADGNIWFVSDRSTISRFTLPNPVSCAQTDDTLCLDHGRFLVQASWLDAQGATGVAHVVEGGNSDSAGLLWFFEPENWELLIKVLDGCSLDGNHWVFGAASTDVHYMVSVTDTRTGATRTYSNPLGVASSAITDTAAFSSCP